ncbi:MAG: DMT family transporter [Candidatus Hydrogenedentota bacterium]
MKSHSLIFLAFLLWSTTPVFVRESGLPLANFVVCANAFGILLLCLFVPRMARRLRQLPPGKIALLGLFVAVNVWSSIEAFALTSISNFMILHYAAPVIVAVAAPFLLGEKPSARTWEALAVSMVGLLAVGGQGLRLGSENDLRGLGLALLSAFAYAVCIMLSRRLAREGADSFAVAVGSSLVLPLVVLPMVDWSAYTTRSATIACGAGAFHLSIASTIYLVGLAGVSAATAGILGYFEILFGIAWGSIIYGEPVTAWTFLGAVCIVVAGWLVLGEKTP